MQKVPCVHNPCRSQQTMPKAMILPGAYDKFMQRDADDEASRQADGALRGDRFKIEERPTTRSGKEAIRYVVVDPETGLEKGFWSNYNAETEIMCLGLDAREGIRITRDHLLSLRFCDPAGPQVIYPTLIHSLPPEP